VCRNLAHKPKNWVSNVLGVTPELRSVNVLQLCRSNNGIGIRLPDDAYFRLCLRESSLCSEVGLDGRIFGKISVCAGSAEFRHNSENGAISGISNSTLSDE
jgi:hypothetical protein